MMTMGQSLYFTTKQVGKQVGKLLFLANEFVG
jgi:hypothetical protein